MASTYIQSKPEDFKYSGPEVWPRISAERMSDLFIFRRPELAYLEALRRKEKVDSGLEPTPHILVIVSYRKYDGDNKRLSTRARMTQKIWHHIKEDRLDDVRKMLVELREVLERMMPHEPNPNIGIVLMFMSERRWKQPLATFQSRWV